MTEAASCECGHAEWRHMALVGQCLRETSDEPRCPCTVYRPAEATEGVVNEIVDEALAPGPKGGTA